jgi:hypothetical protein
MRTLIVSIRQSYLRLLDSIPTCAFALLNLALLLVVFTACTLGDLPFSVPASACRRSTFRR